MHNDSSAHETTRILAVRHGQTDWNQVRRMQGHIDIALNATGHWQARQLVHALVDEPIAAIYSSDLQRAVETARPLANAVGQTIHIEQGLRERNFGRFEGKTFTEIEIAWSDEARRWRQREPDFAPEGGETLTQLRQRTAEIVGNIAARHQGALVLLVTHGGVLDALHRLATGMDVQAPSSWALENAAINRLLWTPQGLTLVGWSDERHLVGDAATESQALNSPSNPSIVA